LSPQFLSAVTFSHILFWGGNIEFRHGREVAQLDVQMFAPDKLCGTGRTRQAWALGRQGPTTSQVNTACLGVGFRSLTFSGVDKPLREIRGSGDEAGRRPQDPAAGFGGFWRGGWGWWLYSTFVAKRAITKTATAPSPAPCQKTKNAKTPRGVLVVPPRPAAKPPCFTDTLSRHYIHPAGLPPDPIAWPERVSHLGWPQLGQANGEEIARWMGQVQMRIWQVRYGTRQPLSQGPPTGQRC
jgi:hypothetical protein